MRTTEWITAEELLRLPQAPDGSNAELIRGELHMMSPAGGRHGECCLNIAARIRAFVKAHALGRVSANDPGVILRRNPDTVLGPDIAYWSRERLRDLPDGFVETVPDLAVEVVSPNDTQAELQEKVRQYLDHGVAAVWVADPAVQTVVIHRAEQDVQILNRDDTLTNQAVLPGFSCEIAEFFE